VPVAPLIPVGPVAPPASGTVAAPVEDAHSIAATSVTLARSVADLYRGAGGHAAKDSRARAVHRARMGTVGPPVPAKRAPDAHGGFRVRARRRSRSSSAAARSPTARTASGRCGRSICFSTARTINQFDVYVGTSSGSLLAALAANGVTSREMVMVLMSEPSDAFPGLDAGTPLSPNLAGLVRTGAMLPRRALELGWRVATRCDRGSLIDGLLRILPAFTARAGIERYLRAILGRARPQRRLPSGLARALSRRDRPRQLRARDLWRAGLGRRPDLARGRGVDRAAVLYAPVRVRDRDLVDGGVYSTTNLDVAVAHAPRS